MSFDADLRSHLQHASVTAYVGERVHPVVRSSTTLPALTYLRATASPQNSILGFTSGLTIIRLQVDVWATTFDAARLIAIAVRDRMNTAAATFKSWMIDETDLYEDDTKIYRVLMEFSVHFTE